MDARSVEFFGLVGGAQKMESMGGRAQRVVLILLPKHHLRPSGAVLFLFSFLTLISERTPDFRTRVRFYRDLVVACATTPWFDPRVGFQRRGGLRGKQSGLCHNSNIFLLQWASFGSER